MLTSVEHLLCVRLSLSFTNLNPYNPGRGTLSPFTHEETALVKVVTRFSDWESWVLWGAFQDVGSLEGANVEAPSVMAEASLLPPVGGMGRPTSHAPSSVLDPEGWWERAIIGLGEITVLSWKLRIGSGDTHPHPGLYPLQPPGVCRAQQATFPHPHCWNRV